MNEHTKSKRQHLLRQIIDRQAFGDQGRVLDALRKEGVEATQATVSRDLHEMGYVKVRVSPGVYRYELLEKSSEAVLWERLRALFKDFVLEIKAADNLLLIKTSPGNANGVASLIDGLRRREILGTVAGDDTILLVVDSAKHRRDVERDFHSLL